MFTLHTQIKTYFYYAILLSTTFFSVSFADTVQIQAQPQRVEQGSVVEVTLPTLKPNQVKTISLVGVKAVKPIAFTKDGETVFIVPIDLRLPPKEYIVRVVSISGRIREVKIIVTERTIPKVTFMPGVDYTATSTDANSTTNVSALVDLSSENNQLKSLPTNNKIAWKDAAFIWPIKDKIVITDTYGYNRSVQNTVITHKGTDFRAATGTPVYAMQRGIVRMAKKFSSYGNTVVIDHGKGIHTLYMHLDSISVKVNTLIEQGTEVGKSGQTGYSFGAHLHVSIWIHGISIDPLSFMSIFNKKADEFAL